MCRHKNIARIVNKNKARSNRKKSKGNKKEEAFENDRADIHIYINHINTQGNPKTHS